MNKDKISWLAGERNLLVKGIQEIKKEKKKDVKMG